MFGPFLGPARFEVWTAKGSEEMHLVLATAEKNSRNVAAISRLGFLRQFNFEMGEKSPKVMRLTHNCQNGVSTNNQFTQNLSVLSLER